MTLFFTHAAMRWTTFAIAALFATAAQAAVTQGPPTGRPQGRSPAPIDSAPQEIRDYLAAAKAANKITDPLARCLAFPDFPGNRWPKGNAEQLCQHVYGPRITRERIQAMLDANQTAELDALFAADLAKHFVDTGFPEIIHQDYVPFDASYESGKQSKQWLELAPNSAFAMVARAEYFREMARTSRGGKYAQETPKENLQRMGEFVDKAVALYETALKIEPRMVQAYSGMLNLAMLDSRAGLEASSIAAMQEIDPACRSIAYYQMMSLEPRWGGSYPKMLALSAKLEPYVARRPILALDTIAPVLDLADMLRRAERWDEMATALETVVPTSANPEIYEPLAIAEGHVKSTPPWKRLVHLVAESRYQVGSTWANSVRGEALFNVAHDPDWALPNILVGLKGDPDNVRLHGLLADTYAVLQRWPEAEAEYLTTIAGESDARQSLYDLTRAMLQAHQYAKAKKYSDQHLRDYPDDPWALYQRARVLTGGGLPQSELYTLLPPMMYFMQLTATTTDSRLLARREEVQSDIAQIQALLQGGAKKP